MKRSWQIATVALLALFGLGARGFVSGWRGLDWLTAGAVLLMLALTLYAGAVVLPAAHAAREAMRAASADPSAALGFARLHRWSDPAARNQAESDRRAQCPRAQAVEAPGQC